MLRLIQKDKDKEKEIEKDLHSNMLRLIPATPFIAQLSDSIYIPIC